MVINVYKPSNWTSFDVVAKFRGMSGIRKVGHAGTLDPLATGVLLLLTGKERKKQQELMNLPKIYEGVITFGATTETYDLEGEIVPSDCNCSLEDIQNKLPEATQKFVGDIEQHVPAFSAKKVDGKPLYKKARKGQVDLENLPTKRVTIDCFDLLGYSEQTFDAGDKKITLPTAKFKICCSSGTYIRSIAFDMGQHLGCGAFLASLERTNVGPYSINDSKTLEDLEKDVKTGVSLE